VLINNYAFQGFSSAGVAGLLRLVIQLR